MLREVEKRTKILVVDDEPHMTLVLTTWLEKHSYDVTRADDGEVALELLRSQAFDVLITDVDMPRMDGLTLIGNLDAVDRLRGIIVLTRRCDHENLSSSCGGPNIRFAPKPFSPTGIVRMVDELMISEPSVASS